MAVRRITDLLTKNDFMKKRQRDILRRAMNACNKLGGELDHTSTHERKYKDRQRALMDVYRVLLAVLSDHPENEQSEYEYELANKALENMEMLAAKTYPDKTGYLRPDEKITQ